MRALRAPEEPDLALIGGPELAKPPEGKVVLAFRALDLDGGERLDLLVFIIDDGNFLFSPWFFHFQLIRILDLLDIAAFPALELAAGRYEHAPAFWTEHRNNHAQYEEINLWMKAAIPS